MAMAATAGILASAIARSRSRSRSRAPSQVRISLPAVAARGRPRKAGPRASRSRTRSNTRSPVRNDGEGNKSLAAKYGRKVSPLGQRLEEKIRASLTPIDTLVRQSVGLDQLSPDLQAHFGEGKYTVFEIANVEDVKMVMDKSLEEPANKDVQTYIKDYSMQVKLINQQNTVVNIRTYEYISRNDLPHGTYVSTQKLVEDGFEEETPHQVLSNTIGGTLFQNSAFCTYNKITKVRNVQLAPGKELVLTLNHQKGNKINSTLYEADNITRQYYTRGIVVQYIGSPCNGPDNGEAFNLPGVGQFKVVWALFKRFHFMNINPHKGATYLDDQVPMIVAGVPQVGVPKWGSGQNGHIMNQAAGLPENITRA